jgi:hypothetical protein
VAYLPCPVMQYCSLVNMESAESDVGLSGLFTLSPLSPTSDSADSMFTKLQYCITRQGK